MTEDRLAAMLEEQNALLRKADRRGGCLWNLVMVLLFGVFYLAWLLVKRVWKVTVWIAVHAWRALRWASMKTWQGMKWAGRQAKRPFER
jgi:hypothetical protein